MHEVEVDAKAAAELAANGAETSISIEYNLCYRSTGVTLTMWVQGKEDFKPVMAAIRKAGYKRLEMNEDTSAKNIEWVYCKPEHGGKHKRLILDVHFPTEGDGDE